MRIKLKIKETAPMSKQQPEITNTLTGDVPPPHLPTSINELRRFSIALSAFISRYDELQNHINSINSSIDSKLPNHLVDTTNPNQSAVTRSLETTCDQTSTDFAGVVVSEQNPKESDSDCERNHAIQRTPESINVSHSSEEINASKKPKVVEVLKNYEEIDVFMKHVEFDTSKKPEVADVSKDHEEIDVFMKPVEIDTSKKPEDVDASQNPEESDTLKKREEIYVSKTLAETDTLKKTEETVLETSCDQITTAIAEAIVSAQNPNETIADFEQIHQNVRTPESIEEVDTLKKNEETVLETYCDQTITVVSEQNPNETVADCEQIHQNVRTPESIEEIDTLKKTEETVVEISCDQTVTAVPEAIVSAQNPNETIADFEQIHQNVRTPESIEEVDTLKKNEETVLETYCDQTITVVSEQNPNETVADCEQIHQNVRTPESIEEIDTLKKTEETVVEISCDQTVTAVPEAIVSEQSPNGMATSHENVRTPENLEDIDASKKPEQTDIMNKPEEIDTLKKPEQTDFYKNPEEIDVWQKPEEIDTSMNTEETDTSMSIEETDTSMSIEETDTLMSVVDTDATMSNKEETDTLKDPEKKDTLKDSEESSILKMIEEINVSMKPKETEKSSKKSIISALEFMCKSMNSKFMKRHVAKHYPEMINLRHEFAKALKLAKDPAKLVLNSIGRFYVQGSRSFCKDEGVHQELQKTGRLASVLILECFVMISSDGIEIKKTDRESAVAEAVIWRKRMIREGGLGHTDEVDARGLLLFISGFGIQDHVFTSLDIMDLIRASNVKGIATALRRSIYLIPKIPDVIYLMVKNNMEIEAVDMAYTFGLEDACRPRSILLTYLHNKIKDIRNGSYLQMLEAMKQQLIDLKSVKQCLESHHIDPSMLLPEFRINERIQNLELEINEGKSIQKRKSSENPIHQESKRACFSHENMLHLQKPVDHYDMSPYSRSTPSSTRHFDFSRNLSNSYITNYSPSSAYNAPAVPENIPVPLHHHVAGGFRGSYDQMVHRDYVQPYGWRGQYDQRYSRHGQTYDSQPYGRPSGWGPPESFPGYLDPPPSFPRRRGPSSDLYKFADIVEKETRAFR